MRSISGSVFLDSGNKAEELKVSVFLLKYQLPHYGFSREQQNAGSNGTSIKLNRSIRSLVHSPEEYVRSVRYMQGIILNARTREVDRRIPGLTENPS